MTEIIVAIFIACAPGPDCKYAMLMLRDVPSCQLFLAAQARALADESGIVPVRVECVPVQIPNEAGS
jgi:hypothetical protein